MHRWTLMKRRKLHRGQEVIIIYDVQIGFVQENSRFTEYRSIKVGDVLHSVPFFECNGKEFSGLNIFWILPSDVKTKEDIQKIQKELIPTQVVVAQIAKELGYNIPKKIRDKEIIKMANEKVDQKIALIQKFGFDPMDDGWIENDLAQTTRERRWFIFERENKLIFADNWDDIVTKFNKKYNESITSEDAKGLSKKRMRYIMGATSIRYSGEKNKKKWIDEARQFEKYHREAENRMTTWTNTHASHFPLVRVSKPIRFSCGKYFNECIEKVPQVFADVSCQFIKPGIVLRVLSYDPQEKYIQLDFTEEVRVLIKNDADNKRPWMKDVLDYNFQVAPKEVDTCLEILELLD